MLDSGDCLADDMCHTSLDCRIKCFERTKDGWIDESRFPVS
jgi:hypothetical protein